MKQKSLRLTKATRGPGFTDLTEEVRRFVAGAGIGVGLLTLFVPHTSASLLIQENADAEVRRDFERFLRRLVPVGDPLFRHTSEGPDDMPAHVRAALTATTLSIPVVGGAPTLGTWQGIYLYEHRTDPHTRKVAAHLIGE
jgi:secondary thiamine-phosphate synthase enzyme